jgi:GntR family transcriptional regulator
VSQRSLERLEVRLRATDRTTAVPLWSKVKSSLTALIRDDGLKEHDRLPSEADLCRIFGVSRSVVREALSQMVNDGLIYRLQGKGAFVRGRREEQDFVGSTVGFSGELAEQHRHVSRLIIRQEVVAAPAPRIRRMLQLDSGQPVVAIDRVLSVDGIPRAIVRWCMVETMVPGLETLSLDNRSLYDTIARQYGVRLLRAERWIEALSLCAEDAALLEVEPGKAALYVESVAAGAENLPIEYYTAVYLTDHSRLHILVASP